MLHDEMGHPGWSRYHEELSHTFAGRIISHLGFGKSDPLDSVRDMATWYMDALNDQHLDKPAGSGEACPREGLKSKVARHYSGASAESSKMRS